MPLVDALTRYIGFVYFASYTYFVSTYRPQWPNAGRCAGEEFAAFSGMGVLTSYLVLFISFYIATYHNKAPKSLAKSTRKTLRRMSQAPVPDLVHNQTTDPEAQSSGAKVNGKANGKGSNSVRSRKA